LEAVALCRDVAGLKLDPWQERVFTAALGERSDGKWAAFEVGVAVSRQNGKGGLLEARELAGLFLFGERLIVHSSHQFDTSLEAFRRLLGLIEDAPELSRRVKRVSRSHGEEGIELKGGQRIRFRTRTKGGGRGFTGDLLILDEAMFLPETAIGALLPTLSARPNPQVWYTGSAVDQLVHPDGVVFARIRERGMAGGDPSLAYFEWSADWDDPDQVPDVELDDPAVWAAANPALGIRISEEHVGRERRSMDPRTFAVERLGVGDWPRTDGLGEVVIDPAVWRALEDPDSQIEGPLWFAFDVTPSRSRGSVAVAGRRADGLWHVELVDRRAGAGWIVDRVAELKAKHHPAGVVCDQAGPAASLVAELERRGVRVSVTSSRGMARACGTLFDAVSEGRLRHMGGDELAAAVHGAAKRTLGDAWAWSRKTSRSDISPLVAVTLALGAADGAAGESVYERRGMLEFALS
jgi:hypothetical protein